MARIAGRGFRRDDDDSLQHKSDRGRHECDPCDPSQKRLPRDHHAGSVKRPIISLPIKDQPNKPDASPEGADTSIFALFRERHPRGAFIPPTELVECVLE
jgi:hypothetical protein